jgi:hypothetical protein
MVDSIMTELRKVITEEGLPISKGDVTGTSYMHKFGQAADFDVADGYVDVWDGANDGADNIMNYTYSTTADIDSLSSSSTGDTQTIRVGGLDVNWDLVIQDITLTGRTRVALTTPLIRVFRMSNQGTTSFAGNVYCYVNGAITAGVPDTDADVRAIVQSDNNQTLMAIYSVPAGYTAYLRSWYASTSGATKTSIHQIKVLARPFGKVFHLKHITAISTDGTSYLNHYYEEPEVFPEKTDIAIRANTDEAAAGVAAGFNIVLVAN